MQSHLAAVQSTKPLAPTAPAFQAGGQTYDPMQGNQGADDEMYGEDARSDFDSKTNNPKLPKFDGTQDPYLWFKQIDVSFAAHKIFDDTQQENWMI